MGRHKTAELGGAVIVQFDAADADDDTVNHRANQVHSALFELVGGVPEHLALVIAAAGQLGGQRVNERQDVTHGDNISDHPRIVGNRCFIGVTAWTEGTSTNRLRQVR